MSDDSGDLAAAEEVAREIMLVLYDSDYLIDDEVTNIVPILEAWRARLVLAAKVEALEPLLSLAWHVWAWYIPAEAVRNALTHLRAQEEKLALQAEREAGKVEAHIEEAKLRDAFARIRAQQEKPGV